MYQRLHVAETSLELLILLPPCPTFWDHRCVPPHFRHLLCFPFLFYSPPLPFLMLFGCFQNSCFYFSTLLYNDESWFSLFFDNFIHVCNALWLVSPHTFLSPSYYNQAFLLPASPSYRLLVCFCDPFRLTRLPVWSLDWNYSLEPDGFTSVYTTKSILLCLYLPGANSCALRVRVVHVPPHPFLTVDGPFFCRPSAGTHSCWSSWLLWLCLAQKILFSSHFHCSLVLTFFPFLNFCSVLWALLGMV